MPSHTLACTVPMRKGAGVWLTNRKTIRRNSPSMFDLYTACNLISEIYAIELVLVWTYVPPGSKSTVTQIPEEQRRGRGGGDGNGPRACYTCPAYQRPRIRAPYQSMCNGNAISQCHSKLAHLPNQQSQAVTPTRARAQSPIGI